MTAEKNETDVEPGVKSVKAVVTGPTPKNIVKAAFAVCCGNLKRAQQLVASDVSMTARDADDKPLYGISGKCTEMTVFTNHQKKEAGVQTPAPAVKGLRL